MTTVKEYLVRLRNADLKIQARQFEIEQLKTLATCTGSLNSDVRVMASKSGDTMSKKVINFVDKEAELQQDIKKLVELRHKIINEIYSLSDTKYSELLFKRYVQYKHFERIACEMSYSYEHARHLHAEALKAFEREVLNTQ